MADRKRYEVTGDVTISVSTVVWAKSTKEALSKANKRGNTSALIEQGNEIEEWITGGELDGTVIIVSCEESSGVDDEEEDDG